MAIAWFGDGFTNGTGGDTPATLGRCRQASVAEPGSLLP